jgi:predicted amidohydrolase YtcJ
MTYYKSLLLTTIIFLAVGCSTKESVDLLVVNAKVYTVDDTQKTATAFAVDQGRFVAVGETETLQNQYKASKVIDAQGKAVTPGLIDAHCHFFGLGQNQQVVDLVGTKSYQEVLDRVVAFNDEKPTVFIRGRGWDQNDWEEKNTPPKTL